MGRGSLRGAGDVRILGGGRGGSVREIYTLWHLEGWDNVVRYRFSSVRVGAEEKLYSLMLIFRDSEVDVPHVQRDEIFVNVGERR